MAQDTEFKEINNTKDTESIKLDSNGDEIVWELKKEILLTSFGVGLLYADSFYFFLGAFI